MDPFLKAISEYTEMTASEATEFRSYFTETTYKRGQVLLQSGDVAHEAFFVCEGALRQYFVNEDGLERTCNFTFENAFLTDLESFSRQARSGSTIVALEPTTCLVIRCVELVKAIEASPAIATFFRAVLEQIATENIKRIQSMLSLSPERQFEDLLSTKPGILQRVSQRYIAQYLGIAPESLSRIRKRIA
ncbi:Crp/Fnr family transcriptional regulator [Sphingobacterium alkalisoli]|uniref:Crp/Fnr family transcriptional regulator n=1 Tax=Sphingobacterium alkalisoli TaxID=1874115 RepID=A0A4U0GUK4_9SPHI|nr:Crp/Fnr family transcriptional regulator [Sphingobacterium alkalisoli]TJY62771.1 Crp/Fnr family transcriptional regulator [Sphingobacterium alkalisoli]GGH28779.1 cyclic nucleotide-binding protein [Sphingobacterium alkalisoli]